jgi:hypothetical protein
MQRTLMPLTERLLELVPFMIRRLAVVERVRQREAGQGSTGRSRPDPPVGIGVLVTRRYAKQGTRLTAVLPHRRGCLAEFVQ